MAELVVAAIVLLVIGMIPFIAALFSRTRWISGPVALPWLGTVYHPVVRGQIEELHSYDYFLAAKYGWSCARTGLYRAWFFSTSIVGITRTADVKAMFGRQSDCFDRSSIEQASFKELLGDGLILISNGPTWHRHRTVMAPAFNHANLKAFFNATVKPTLEEAIPLLGSTRSTRAGAAVRAGFVDAQDAMERITFKLACQFVLGIDVTQYVPDPEALWSHILRTSSYRMLFPIPWWRVWSTADTRRYDEEMDTLHRVSMLAVDQAAVAATGAKVDGTAADATAPNEANDGGGGGGGGGGGDAEVQSITALLVEEHLQSPDTMPVAAIEKELFTFLFAGHDTTTNILTWALCHLARDKDIQAKARSEVEAVLQSRVCQPAASTEGVSCRVLEYDELHKDTLPFLHAVVKETLRLYPSAPMRGRKVVNEVVSAGGVVLQKGQEMFCNIFALHRNPAKWEKPEEFDPRRWLPGAAGSRLRSSFDYIPFGAGQRRCIGERLANMLMLSILGSVLAQYSLEIDDESAGPAELELCLTLRAKNGVQIKFR